MVKGRLKLIDLGSARQLEEGKDHVELDFSQGTDGFMAPEYFQPVEKTETGNVVYRFSTKSDVFALGIILKMLLEKCFTTSGSENISTLMLLNNLMEKSTEDDPNLRPSVSELKQAI